MNYCDKNDRNSLFQLFFSSCNILSVVFFTYNTWNVYQRQRGSLERGLSFNSLDFEIYYLCISIIDQKIKSLHHNCNLYLLKTCRHQLFQFALIIFHIMLSIDRPMFLKTFYNYFIKICLWPFFNILKYNSIVLVRSKIKQGVPTPWKHWNMLFFSREIS